MGEGEEGERVVSENSSIGGSRFERGVGGKETVQKGKGRSQSVFINYS